MLLHNVIPIKLIDFFQQSWQIFLVKERHCFLSLFFIFEFNSLNFIEDLDLSVGNDGFKVDDEGVNGDLFIIVVFRLSKFFLFFLLYFY